MLSNLEFNWKIKKLRLNFIKLKMKLNYEEIKIKDPKLAQKRAKKQEFQRAQSNGTHMDSLYNGMVGEVDCSRGKHKTEN